MKKQILTFILLLFVFKVNAQLTTLLTFSGTTNGACPRGSFYFDGTYLYGMTSGGGSSGYGTIFKIKPDGSGYIKLLDFAGTLNGKNPFGTLISDGIFLYGITAQGGKNNSGSIFKIKHDGTGFDTLLNFSSTVGGGSFGSLFYDGTFLYWTGGSVVSSFGAIFKIKPDGTGYTKLFDFNGTNGRSPSGNLIYDGTFLYGMTEMGGTGTNVNCSGGGCGVVFKIKPDGTGFDTLMSFNSTNGANPYGSLVYDGTFLYGIPSQGGLNNIGIIFKIKPDGSGYSKLLDFNITNGCLPVYSALYYDGTFLYGTTASGGNYGHGVIFKIKPNGTGYTDLYDFNVTDGETPVGTLISDGTCLYGMTSQNCNTLVGTVYKLCGVMEVKHEVRNNEQISIYPNPTNNSISISCTETINAIRIYDALGSIVQTHPLIRQKAEGNVSTIDISNLQEGIYLVSVKTNDGLYSQKVVVQR